MAVFVRVCFELGFHSLAFMFVSMVTMSALCWLYAVTPSTADQGRSSQRREDPRPTPQTYTPDPRP
eukprot:2739154-Rhodomonas_salina.1